MSLEYERPRPAVTRRQVWLLLFVSLVNTTLLIGYLVGPPLYRMYAEWKQKKAATAAAVAAAATVVPSPTVSVTPTVAPPTETELLKEQSTWLAYRAPADQVVYEEDPDRAAALLSKGSDYTASSWIASALEKLSFQPPARLRLDVPNRFGGNSYTASIFIGKVISPSGNVRLVHVHLKPAFRQRLAGNSREMRCSLSLSTDITFPGFIGNPAEQLTANSIKPTPSELAEDRMVFSLDASQGVISPRDDLIRVYAGQVDPAKPSEIQIPFERGRQKRLLAINLRDDEDTDWRVEAR